MTNNDALTGKIGFCVAVLFSSMVGYEAGGWSLALFMGAFGGFVFGFVGGALIGIVVAAAYIVLRIFCM